MTLARFFFALCAFVFISFQVQAQSATTTRSLSNFNNIAISGGYDVLILKEGNSESIVLETSGIDPEKIITEVKNNTLQIRTKNGSYYNFKARLTVTYRSLTEIANSGSTDIEFQSTLKGDEFEFASSGSGDLKGNFDVKKLRIAISGSSDMKLSGNADDQDIAISGSGDVDASKLKGKSARVSISGSGDVDLNVDGPVKSSVSGSGDISNQ
jgi:hypothetical protein